MLFGLAALVLTGLLGRRLAGDAVGLVAAGIGAVSPNFWLNDSLIMSESLAVLLTVAALLLAYRARDLPTWPRFIALGVVCALAALTRAELALLTPLLVLPLAVRGRDWRAFLGRAAAGLGAAVLVVLPWFVYNQSRFEARVLMSTNDGLALAGSNCDSVYHGELLGYTALWCRFPTPPGDQSQQSVVWRDRAFDYMEDNVDRLPAVMSARVGRLWQLYDPFGNADLNVFEGRPVWGSTWGIITTWVLVPFAIGGIVVARRRRIVAWPLFIPIIVVTFAAAVVFGQPRFRAPAEPSLAILGAIAAVALVERIASSRSRQSITSDASSSS
jgi:4-amino-4-deoxy-L-arabinose transferase-like glycosyltransferase